MNKPASVEAKSSSDDVLDRWMISRVHELVRDSTTGYEEYKLDEATRGIADIIDDISVWYTRRSRERLKGDAGIEDQVRAYETLTCVLQTLAKVVAPVMPFIAERVYQQTGGTRESVHLESWPQGGSVDEKVIADMKDVRAAVSLGLMKRTEEKINVKQPLLSVTLKKSVDATYFDLIKDELNVKEVLINESQEAEVSLNVTMTDELVKEGDVRKLIRAVQDMRKEKGLTPGDSIVLKLSSKDKLGDLSLLMTTCRVTDIQEDSSLTENKVDVSSGNLYFELSKI
jgi:isoleucyl-tRNA synthetase